MFIVLFLEGIHCVFLCGGWNSTMVALVVDVLRCRRLYSLPGMTYNAKYARKIIL